MRMHAGEKPYCCSACSFAASYPLALKKHMLAAHPDTTQPPAASRASMAEQNASDDDVSVLTDDASEGEASVVVSCGWKWHVSDDTNDCSASAVCSA